MSNCNSKKQVYHDNTCMSAESNNTNKCPSQNSCHKPNPCPTPCPKPNPCPTPCHKPNPCPTPCPKPNPCPTPCPKPNPCPTPCPKPNPCPSPCPCPGPTPNNCEAVLAEFHKLIKESEALYDKADEIVQGAALSDINKAIIAIVKALDMKVVATEVEEKANLLLEESNCSFNCNKDLAKCKALKCKAQEFYNLENREIIEALRLLEEAACKIEKAKYYDSEGDKYEAQYISCIHNTTC